MRLIRPIFRLPSPRSNGIAVRHGIARLIRLGDAARARGDWLQAASAYSSALARAPWLAHIWIQLGHAHKESGEIETALGDYARAADISPSDPDPRIHLGLSAKLLGRLGEANEHYLAALERKPDDLPATIDALRTAPPCGSERDRVMASITAILGIEWSAKKDGNEEDVSLPLCIDITDLLAYFGRARLPTGIQRVQIEIVAAIGAADPDLATICCYSAQRLGWSAVGIDRFLRLAQMALASDDRDDLAWRREVAAVHLELARSPVLRFSAGAVLLNLGTSWSERNYFLHVRAAREDSGLAYVPIVYDCIPMFAPQWFPTALVRDYRGWMDGLFHTADGVIAISQATRADLVSLVAGDGGQATSDAIRVVQMDGDFRRSGQAPVPIERLAHWGLESEAYVLMVSTIEPRKNHVGAFNAWLKLVARHGFRRVPKLVCVGGKGWLNDAVHALIRRHRTLRRKIILLSGIADADLDLLYRHALFTLYPSLYEGWGLPVTESLCHGRVPAVSNGSSLPEAGGPFAIYFDPNDPAAIANAITPLLDPDVRRQAEARIRETFRPRSWREIGLALAAEALDLAGHRPIATGVPRAETGIFYALGTDIVEQDNWQAGERFRYGWNWPQPGARGNPIDNVPSILRMMIPAGDWIAQLRISADHAAILHIKTTNGALRHRIEPPSAESWVEAPLASDADGVAEIHLRADGPILLAGFMMIRPGVSSPSISGSTPA